MLSVHVQVKLNYLNYLSNFRRLLSSYECCQNNKNNLKQDSYLLADLMNNFTSKHIEETIFIPENFMNPYKTCLILVSFAENNLK